MKISIEYECGETTCAIERGKFCKFVRVSHFGQKYHCGLFVDTSTGLMPKLFEDNNGWLARCPECLEHEKKTKQGENS